MTERITIEVEYEIEYCSEGSKEFLVRSLLERLPVYREESTPSGRVIAERMNTKLKEEK